MEKCHTTKGNILSAVFAVVLFVVGTLIGLHGFYHYIKSADDAYDQAIKNPELKPSTIKGGNINYIEQPSNLIEVITIFNGTDVFSVNSTITAKIYALVNNIDTVDRMVAIPPEKVKEAGWREGTNLDIIVKDGKITIKPKD
jgi:hypothetical protein